MTPGPQGFGEGAGEMSDETEVEAPLREEGAPAPAGEGIHQGAEGVDAVADETDGGDEASLDQAAGDELAVVRMESAERLADLQRLQAEFVNYKRRVERDRGLLAENARYQVLVPIIEVLDNVDRAREHGALDDGFASVADQLERVVAGLGLTRFGQPGEAFDPNLHEALSTVGEDPEVEVTTCQVIAKAGYRIGDRVVRAAQVLVVDPASS